MREVAKDILGMSLRKFVEGALVGTNQCNSEASDISSKYPIKDPFTTLADSSQYKYTDEDVPVGRY